jgi:hypothetical protein
MSRLSKRHHQGRVVKALLWTSLTLIGLTQVVGFLLLIVLGDE